MFSAKSKGLLGKWRSDRPKRRSDRLWKIGQTGHKVTLDFGARPKIKGVGKRVDSTALGLTIFGASRQKFYWIENSSRFRTSREEILAKSKGGGQIGLVLAVRPVRERSDQPMWQSDQFWLLRRAAWRRCLLVRSSSWVSLHRCCMMHVLTNMGQVMKNLCPKMVDWFIVVQVTWSQLWSTTRRTGTWLGEPRSRMVVDVG